jgi:hypothetical protein
MSNESTKKQSAPARRPQTSLELSAETRAALARIKKNHGVIKTRAIENGVALFEASLTKGTK